MWLRSERALYSLIGKGICRIMKKAKARKGKEQGNHPVLVLGHDRGKAFSRTLADTSFSPKFLNSMEALLHALSHTRAKAILVDREQNKADELEFVLNVRDMDGGIPILLIGSTRNEGTDKILEGRHATFLVRKPITDCSLAEELKRITEPPAHQ
jgi:DNA-binding NtrC family response regulator